MDHLALLSGQPKIQKRPLGIVFSNHFLSINRHQEKITSAVNWLKNTFFFLKKYQVDLILFANHSAHTSNITTFLSSERAKPPVIRGWKAAGLSIRWPSCRTIPLYETLRNVQKILFVLVTICFMLFEKNFFKISEFHKRERKVR